MTTTTNTSATITPEEAEQLWYDGIEGAYDDEPNNDDAECGNCGCSYGAHDGTACPSDDDDECEGEGFAVAVTVDCLSADARKGGALEAKLIAAYEASKHVDYADMPAYDDSDEWNPWNIMNDCFIAGDFAECVDTEAFEKAYEWVEGWMNYTREN